jgi:hypothetical protein
VVVRYSSSNDRGFVQVKVLDFGLAENFVSSNLAVWLRAKDTGMLIHLMNIIIHDCSECRNQVDETLEPRSRVQAERSTYVARYSKDLKCGLAAENRAAYLETMWEELGIFVEIGSMSNGFTMQIRKVIDSVSYALFETIGGKIQDLLTAAGSAE